MILKIKSPEEGWFMYDGLSRVRYGVGGPIHFRHRGEDENVDGKAVYHGFEISDDWSGYWPSEGREALRYFIPDVVLTRVTRITSGNDNSPTSNVAWVIATNAKGETKIFVFDEAFLLNDHGRTIERIVR